MKFTNTLTIFLSRIDVLRWFEALNIDFDCFSNFDSLGFDWSCFSIFDFDQFVPLNGIPVTVKVPKFLEDWSSQSVLQCKMGWSKLQKQSNLNCVWCQNSPVKADFWLTSLSVFPATVQVPQQKQDDWSKLASLHIMEVPDQGFPYKRWSL